MLLIVLFWLLHPFGIVQGETTTPNTGDQAQGFLFGYNSVPPILPIVASCPIPLPFTPITPTNNGGPDAASPFSVMFLAHEQLLDPSGVWYGKTYAKTTVFDHMDHPQFLNVPFLNGTQFIACVWAANQISGGCQNLVNVVTPAVSANISSCYAPGVMGSWVTPPNRTLSVTMQGGNGGVVSENGWPNTCSDLQFTPQNGTGPYTLVIAPANHPPVNITAKSGAMNYTIRLTHGQPFMAAMFDSANNSWAVGPLHAGDSGTDLNCLRVLSGQTTPQVNTVSNGVTVAAMVGGVLGSFVLGAMLAIGAFLLFAKRHWKDRKDNRSQDSLDAYSQPRPAHPRQFNVDGPVEPFIAPDVPATSPSYRRMQSDSSKLEMAESRHDSDRRRSTIGILPYSPSSESLHSSRDEDERSNRNQRTSAGMSSPLSINQRSGDYMNAQGTADPVGPNVYVVHSDGGGGNVHIQLPQSSARVVELPPNYVPPVGGASSGSQMEAAGRISLSSGEATSRAISPLGVGGVTSLRNEKSRPVE